MDSIATLDLAEIAATGRRTSIRVEIGRPHPDPRGGWACPVLVDGLDGKVRDIFGEDSLQALCLGLRIVRVHLACVLERGSRLVDARDDSDFPLEVYFKDLPDENATPSA